MDTSTCGLSADSDFCLPVSATVATRYPCSLSRGDAGRTGLHAGARGSFSAIEYRPLVFSCGGFHLLSFPSHRVLCIASSTSRGVHALLSPLRGRWSAGVVSDRDSIAAHLLVQLRSGADVSFYRIAGAGSYVAEPLGAASVVGHGQRAVAGAGDHVARSVSAQYAAGGAQFLWQPARAAIAFGASWSHDADADQWDDSARDADFFRPAAQDADHLLR